MLVFLICIKIHVTFRSQRMYYGLQQEYHAKGERSVAQAAKMVGFNLPHEEKIERRSKPKSD